MESDTATDRKQPDKTFEPFIELAPNAMIMVEQDGKIALVNSQMEKLFGYSREELIGQSVEILVPEPIRGKHPEFRAAFQAEPQFRTMGSAGNVFGLRKDGQQIPVEVGLRPVELENGLAVLCAITDMSEHGRAFETIHAIVESSPDAILLVGRDGEISLVNSETERMFGYSRAELTGEPIEILVPDRVREKHSEYREAFVAEHRSRPVGFHADFSARRKDGSEFPVEIGLRPIRLEGGTFVICTARDITKRKRIEYELEVARQIQQALLPKESPSLPGFDLAGVSHPAESTGGDFFDFISLPGGQLGVVVGDVSGHGFGPAILTAATHSYVRALARVHTDLSQIMTTANQLLFEDTRAERFVTLMFARLDPSSRSFDLASAGHPDGYVFDSLGVVKRRLCSTGPPLGVSSDSRYPVEGAVSLEAGDMVLFVTDGIQEATSREKELFGCDRLLDVVQRNRDKSARQIVTSLFHAASEFTQRTSQLDDMTAVLIKTH